MNGKSFEVKRWIFLAYIFAIWTIDKAIVDEA
jgi:hypothetical protein